MDTILNMPTMALMPLEALGGKLGAFLPSVVAAVILLFVGGLAAYWVRLLVERVLNAVRIDDYSRKVGFSGILNRLGLGPSLVHLVGTVLHVTVILAFVLGAAEAVG